jgi:GNAT superfamily N-acetyltransferase
MSHIIYRPATPDDATAIAYQRRCMVIETGYGSAESYADTERRYADWVRAALADGRYYAHLACEGAEIVAGGGVYFYDWFPRISDPIGHYAYITNVYTQPPYRRRGIARQLMSHLLDQCRAHGVSLAMLDSTPDGHSLYESLGFTLHHRDQPELHLKLNAQT